MSTLSLDYGTSTGITITLNGLTTNSLRQGAFVAGAGAIDHILGGSFTAGASGTSSTGTATVYIAPSTDEKSTYAGGADGTNSAYSARKENLILAKTVDIVANNGVYTWSGLSVAAVCGQMPKWYSVVVLNSSGGTLAAGSIHYQPVNIISA